MLLPDKHIRLSESLLGLGAFILTLVDEPQSVDAIWAHLQTARNTEQLPAYHSFDNVVVTISFLYSIGAIAEKNDGGLARCV